MDAIRRLSRWEIGVLLEELRREVDIATMPTNIDFYMNYISSDMDQRFNRIEHAIDKLRRQIFAIKGGDK